MTSDLQKALRWVRDSAITFFNDAHGGLWRGSPKECDELARLLRRELLRLAFVGNLEHLGVHDVAQLDTATVLVISEFDPVTEALGIDITWNLAGTPLADAMKGDACDRR